MFVNSLENVVKETVSLEKTSSINVFGLGTTGLSGATTGLPPIPIASS